MFIDYLQFAPILLSIVIAISSWYLKKKSTFKKVQIFNFVMLGLFYIGMLYVHRWNYIDHPWYEVDNQTLVDFFVGRAYQLSIHILGFYLFSILNTLVFLKHYPKLEE